MSAKIEGYRNTSEEDAEIISLLLRVYVEAGFTDEARSRQTFTPNEVKARGQITLARSPSGRLLGMVICAGPDNPHRQVAADDEAEMHLLAVEPEVRGQGLGELLCLAFERKAASLGYAKLVLSTQPTMVSAQRLYERLGYKRSPARDWLQGERRFLVFEKSLSPAAESDGSAGS